LQLAAKTLKNFVKNIYHQNHEQDARINPQHVLPAPEWRFRFGLFHQRRVAMLAHQRPGRNFFITVRAKPGFILHDHASLCSFIDLKRNKKRRALEHGIPAS
jgi:hypothetical protein